MNIDSTVVQKKQSVEGQPQQTSKKPTDKSFKDELLELDTSSAQSLPSELSGKTAPDDFGQKQQVTQIVPEQNLPSEEFAELADAIKQMNVQTEPGVENNIPQKMDFSTNEVNPLQNLVVKQDKEQETPLQMLNNDMNINKPQEKMQELKADINFNQSGSEAFSSFLGSNNFKETSEELSEDNSILVDAAENIAMVNRAIAMKNSSDIEEVGAVVDKSVSYTELNLTRNDVNFFVNLVNNKVEMDNVSTEDVRQVQVSEKIFNLLAESMRNNKAFRLNFDNDISIIIKVSREGRISAHFMPGSDIAENYLRNNLSSLVQKFEEENIPYDELTQQRHKRNNDEHNNKKDKENE